MENRPVQIDLKTGRQLHSSTSALCQEAYSFFERTSMFKTRYFSDSPTFANTFQHLASPRLKTLLSSERSETMKAVTAMGDAEKRLLKPLPITVVNTPSPLKAVHTPSFNAAMTPLPVEVVHVLPRANTDPVRQRPLDEDSKRYREKHGRSQPEIETPSPAPFKLEQTPPRAPCDQSRRKLVDDKVEQDPERVQKRTAADENRGVQHKQIPVRRDVAKPKSKLCRPRARSATFVVEKPRFTKTSVDIKEPKNARPPSKSVSSNLLRTPKVDERPKTPVRLNKAARLRLEQFNKK